MDRFEEITLIDPEANKSYKLRVSAEDAEKARHDMNFASALLRNAQSFPHKEERNEKEITSGTLNLVENGPERENDGTYNWSRAESLLLISLYKINEDMFTSGKATQKHCWDRISRLFAEKGYAISGRKCCTKFQALKRTYKNIKDHNNKSGNSSKTWDYLAAMEDIFKEKPWIAPMSTAGSDDIECSSPIVAQKTAKSKQSEYLKELLIHKKERDQKRDIQHNEKLNALAELRDLMRQCLPNK